MDRVIVLDTETTGLSPNEGHRIVEIGCVELVQMRKGEGKQWYINPERDIPMEVVKIHGITNEKVANSPRFVDMVGEFLDFIKNDSLVIHNAAFDMSFLNAELKKIKRRELQSKRVIDTIPLARRKFPGSSVSLDALCKRFKIDNTHRTFHGALLDSDLLAEVYVELLGGNQFSLDFSSFNNQAVTPAKKMITTEIQQFPHRNWPVSEEELLAHTTFLDRLQRESGACIWLSNTAN